MSNPLEDSRLQDPALKWDVSREMRAEMPKEFRDGDAGGGATIVHDLDENSFRWDYACGDVLGVADVMETKTLADGQVLKAVAGQMAAEMDMSGDAVEIVEAYRDDCDD